MIVDFERGFVFIHIPKTGGTSLRTALDGESASLRRRLLRKIGWFEPLNRRIVSKRTKHETHTEWMTRLERSRTLDPRDAEALVPVVFCRHPVTRFQSLHAYLRRTHAQAYPDVPGDVNAFAQMVQEDSADWLRDIRSLRPQIDYLPSNRDALIGSFEELDSEFRRIFSSFGIVRDLPEKNAGSIPLACSPFERGMTPETCCRIENMYANDMSHFSYRSLTQ